MTADPTQQDAAPRAGGAWERFADLATLALAVAWLARLVPQALSARLQTDECFHAWVSRWVSVHGALPESVPVPTRSASSSSRPGAPWPGSGVAARIFRTWPS